MTTNLHDTSIDNYFYSDQLKKYIIQFMAVFTGLKVSVGKNDFNSVTNLMSVPIRYGTSDRVVDHIISEGTQNKMIRLPIMGVNMINFALAPIRRKGIGTIKRDVRLPRGGVMPEDLVNRVSLMPIPYDVTMELAIWTSNQQQMFEILEQILLLFAPMLQLQVSDDAMDNARITTIELMDISLERQIPAGVSKQLHVTNLQFTMPIYLSQPVNLKKNIVNSIRLRLDVINKAEDVYQAVCDITNETEVNSNLFNIDDMDVPPN